MKLCLILTAQRHFISSHISVWRHSLLYFKYLSLLSLPFFPYSYDFSSCLTSRSTWSALSPSVSRTLKYLWMSLMERSPMVSAGLWEVCTCNGVTEKRRMCRRSGHSHRLLLFFSRWKLQGSCGCPGSNRPGAFLPGDRSPDFLPPPWIFAKPAFQSLLNLPHQGFPTDTTMRLQIQNRDCVTLYDYRILCANRK